MEKEKVEQKSKCGCCGDEFVKTGKTLAKLVKDAKAKYDGADNNTKKKVIAGIAGAAALIAGVIGYHKIKNDKK
jgi:hypothetical protein